MQRVLISSCGLGIVLLLAGCNHTRWNIFNPSKGDSGGSNHPQEVITADQLVDYMNQNAARLQSLQCTDVRLTGSKANGLGLAQMSLYGSVFAEQPKGFRLKAKMNNKSAVDLGSNNQEFWYWLSLGPPYQFYCSYQDLEIGKISQPKLLPPFQPEWVMETLGMSNYGPATRYQLVDEGDRIKLIEHVKSPSGKPMQKIIVFNRKAAKVPTPQVVAFILIDGQTKQEICSAHVHSAQLVPISAKEAATLPEKMTLFWKEENLKLTMHLVNPEANRSVSPAVFVRQTQGITNYNLATGKIDGHPASLQHAGGWVEKQ